MFIISGLLASLSIAPLAYAGDAVPSLLEVDDAVLSSEPRANLWTGEGVSLGGILFPHLHLNSAFGTSTADSIDAITVGHHDPNREGFTFQNIELGSSLRLGENLEGFATYAAVIDQDNQWSGVLEEAFLKLKSLPGGFELRGGRYFNRFGFYNAVHPHGYLFVDKDLLEGRMLGEDGFATEGGEITWRMPTPFTSALSYSYGRAFVEEEEHGHGEEEEESRFEGEGAAFVDAIHSLHWLAKHDLNDFHQFTGHLSAAWGDNAYGLDTQVYTAGLEYLWRENGYEPDGRHLRWRTAVMTRDIDAISGHLPGEEEEEEEDYHEPALRGNHSGVGVSSSLHYGWNQSWEAGLGASWVEGIAGAGLEEDAYFTAGHLAPDAEHQPQTSA
ncbi:MAG: hypothetical protein R3F19_18005 [Verrucomicrobiales bacterium]